MQRLSSLKNDAFIAGLARNQDTGSQGFRGAVDGAAENYDAATIGGIRDRRLRGKGAATELMVHHTTNEEHTLTYY